MATPEQLHKIQKFKDQLNETIRWAAEHFESCKDCQTAGVYCKTGKYRRAQITSVRGDLKDYTRKVIRSESRA